MWKASFRHVLEHGSGDDQVVIAPSRRQLVLKFQHVGLPVTDDGNSSRIQLRLESIEHRGCDVKCVYGLCVYIFSAKRIQQGEGCRPKTDTSIQNPKLRTQKAGMFK